MTDVVSARARVATLEHMNFAPCPTCQRHVKVADARCPFCGKSAPASRTPAAAVLLFGIGLAVGGCSSSTETPAPVSDASDAADTPMMDAAYGPPPDTGIDTNPVAAYGPAPSDTGFVDDADAKDSLPSGAYGPPPDAG